MLEVEDIHVSYGRLVALRGVSLHVGEGEIVCVIGPNGAGKSTMLAAIAGGVPLQAGTVRLGGKVIAGMVPEAISRLGVSLVPEGRHVFATLTVAENLRIGTFQRRDRANVNDDFRRILEHFPQLRERLGQPAGRLSGGEQQMLVIARALLTRPRHGFGRRAVARPGAAHHRSGLRNPDRSPPPRRTDAADQRTVLRSGVSNLLTVSTCCGAAVCSCMTAPPTCARATRS